MTRPFVFWQNAPNHLQAPWLSALAGKTDVVVATEGGSDLPKWRIDLGWRVPEYGAARLDMNITAKRSAEIIEEMGPTAIHVFTGAGAYPAVDNALSQCIKAERHIGLMAERCYPDRLMAAFRFAKYKLVQSRIGNAVEFVLGVGAGAPPWYRSLGYRRDRIFEFGYFPPRPPKLEQANEGIWPPDKVRLVFVGQLIRRKGVDQLLEALGSVANSNWSLGLLGGGADENELRALANRVCGGRDVLFWGARANDEAMSIVAAADVLVLPSRFDGYGAVVNEALLRGVPVVCSASSGARQAVEAHPEMGAVFTGSGDLRLALDQWIKNGRRTGEASSRIRARAECVSPEAAADYFLEMMNHVYSGSDRPVPPWRRRSDAEMIQNPSFGCNLCQ